MKKLVLILLLLASMNLQAGPCAKSQINLEAMAIAHTSGIIGVGIGVGIIALFIPEARLAAQLYGMYLTTKIPSAAINLIDTN